MIRSRRALLLCLLPLACPAHASALRWEPAAEGAAIVLPVPAKAEGIVGGTLACAEQAWTLRLRAEGNISEGTARLTVGENRLTLPVKVSAGTVEIALPAESLALLKDGTDLAITLGEGDEGSSARFPLAGSRTAIGAVAPLCAPAALPGFEAVALAADGEAADAARGAAAEEAALFHEATGKEPALTAAFVPGQGGKMLLFASFCGSSRYYGASGCKLMGFSRPTASEAWTPAYESEGMHLFRDPHAAHEGWPDLVTVALGEAGERLRWAWRNGGFEAMEEPAVASAAPLVIDELRTGTTEP